jgi:hypothetical protein
MIVAPKSPCTVFPCLGKTMISAFIIQTLGLHWAFHIVAMFICPNLVSMPFFMPETKFRGDRPSILRNTLVPTFEKTGGIHVEVSEEGAEPKKRTYFQELKLWGQFDPEVSFVRAFLRPFILLAYPTVL